MSGPSSLDPGVLGRILLLQSTLNVAPDEERLCEMMVHALEELPGVAGCKVFIQGDADLANSLNGRRFRYLLSTSERQYGSIDLCVADETAFDPYDAFVGNTANLAALYIENARNAQAVRQINRTLEAQVAERTAALSDSAKRLDHLNRVLSAIRNVNQLITHEKDGDSLLETACHMLVETRGYQNAWIGLVDESGVMGRCYQAGFDSEFDAVIELLNQGIAPECARECLQAGGVHVILDPVSQCSPCPLAAHYEGRARQATLATRIEHGDHLFGWLSVSVPQAVAQDVEEQSLLTEAASDIAFALWSIETEAQRELTERKYRDILASTSDAVVAMDLNGIITLFNAGAEKLYGYSAQSALGMAISQFCPEDRLIEQKKLIQGVIENGFVQGFETERITADGRRIPVEMTISLLKDSQGQPIGTSAIIRDISERKRAEESLRESEQRLKEAERLSHLGSWSRDIATGKSSWSDEFFRICGLEPGSLEPAAELAFAIIHPDDRAQAIEAVNRAIETGIPYDIEIRIVLPDGSVRWLHSIGRLDYDEQGAPLRLVGSFLDITEQHYVDAALRESEERFRALVESAPMSILVVRDGKYVYANPQSVNLMGFDRAEQFIGMDVFETISPELQPVRRQSLTRVNETSDSSPTELQFLRSDGSPVWVITSSVDVQMDGEPTTIIVGQDVTDRRKAEEKHELLMMAIEQAAETILITDTDGIIQYVNPTFEKITGYSRQEALGQNPRILHSGVQSSAFYSEMWDTLLRGETWQGQLVNQKKDGTLYTEDAVISPVRDAAGRTVNYVAVKRDITAELKLEEQLRQSQKMEAVGRLAGGVAHDFNNMLSVILGYAEMALDVLDPSQPLYADLLEIEGAAQRSAELTQQLLAFARRQTVSPQVLDLNETVSGMLKMLGRLIGEDVDLVWNPAAELWPIEMDPTQINQVLANLCVNARDAIVGVGRITIESHNVVFDADSCTGIEECIPGDYIQLCVSDNGNGMDEQTRSKIFEPFFTTKEPGKGTGLGLSTVYGIVRQNKGFVNVYSEIGLGTTFKIYLPRYIGKLEASLSAVSDKSDVGGHETILLVEDEPTILNLTRLMLEKLGYCVLTAETPGKAIALAENHSGEIHLLITDVVMPEMNGRDLARDLLKLYPEMKRLFMSGYTADVIAHQGVLDRGVGFLHKPFNREQLGRKVRQALKKN